MSPPPLWRTVEGSSLLPRGGGVPEWAWSSISVKSLTSLVAISVAELIVLMLSEVSLAPPTPLPADESKERIIIIIKRWWSDLMINLQHFSLRLLLVLAPTRRQKLPSLFHHLLCLPPYHSSSPWETSGLHPLIQLSLLYPELVNSVHHLPCPEE